MITETLDFLDYREYDVRMQSTQHIENLRIGTVNPEMLEFALSHPEMGMGLWSVTYAVLESNLVGFMAGGWK